VRLMHIEQAQELDEVLARSSKQLGGGADVLLDRTLDKDRAVCDRQQRDEQWRLR
jgi:hypothetical protein